MSQLNPKLENSYSGDQEKTHVTVLEVDLDAITHNIEVYRNLLQDDVLLMVMVKAQAYGSGAIEVARFLEKCNVDYLGVAFTDEGVTLKEHGIDLPIMVMNPEIGSLETLIEAGLEPEIYSFEILARFERALERQNASTPYPIHLKIDSGMHRLGFQEPDLPELLDKLANSSALAVKSVFTHLAAADDENHDHFTIQQLELFKRMSIEIKDRLGEDIFCHGLNSAGISRFQDYQMDLVRLGIGAYGVSPDPSLELKTVCSLKTTIAQIKEISAGESVGYNRSYVASEPRKIATLPLGYGDGLFRSLGNGKLKMMVGNKSAPVVGDICMDLCMIDVTDIACSAGDEVVVFGKDPTVQDLAKAAETIPYEVLSAISHRVARVYVQGD